MGERIPLDPEDEELLRDDDPVTPIKPDGLKTKERPTDKGVSWLVKTQYISPLSMDSTKQVMHIQYPLPLFHPLPLFDGPFLAQLYDADVICSH